jgi:hypothetical protein
MNTATQKVSDKMIEADFRAWWKSFHGDSYFGAIPLVECIRWARSVLTRYSNPTATPLTERPPEEADLRDGFCWFWDSSDRSWLWERADSIFIADFGSELSWLPHWALPLPAEMSDEQ